MTTSPSASAAMVTNAKPSLTTGDSESALMAGTVEGASGLADAGAAARYVAGAATIAKEAAAARGSLAHLNLPAAASPYLVTVFDPRLRVFTFDSPFWFLSWCAEARQYLCSAGPVVLPAAGLAAPGHSFGLRAGHAGRAL